MPRTSTRWALWLLAATILGSPGALRGQDAFNSFMSAVGGVFKNEVDKKDKAAQFELKTKSSLIMQNNSDKVWKFGFVKQNVSENGKKESGNIRVQMLGALSGELDPVELKKAPLLTGGEEGYALRVGDVAIFTPVHDSYWVVSSAEFNRTVYLEDDKHNRCYFNLYKYAPKDPPQFSYTEQSKPRNEDDHTIEFKKKGGNVVWITKSNVPEPALKAK